MDCKCGGNIISSEYVRKTDPRIVYTRRCLACHREEKSADLQKWDAPFNFWNKYGLGGQNGLF